MKKTGIIQFFCVALAICMILCGLTACSGKAITLTVKDMGESSSIESNVGSTVAKALEGAKITLGEKDETEPSKDSKITEDLKEITIKRYAKVTVVYGDEKKEVELTGGTVADAVKAAAFKTDDSVTPDVPATDYLKDGMTINLVKGMKVELTVDGKTTEVATKAATVKDFLTEQKVTLGENDEVSEKLDEKIKDGMKIVVKRVEYKEEKKTEEVDFKTEEKHSDSMASGTSEVTQEGIKGEKEVTYKVKYVDGKEDSREVVSEKVTKEPVNKIVTYGSASGGSDNSGSDNSGSGNSGSNDSGSNDSGSNDSGSNDSGSNDSGSGGGVTEVSRTPVPDCDGSGHGYYIITYSDGHQEYEEY
ncbi:G5 domain-containing protein [Ruminococcus sp.]|uniref:G5 domain-containing protein n=1 Tax=Ruminococcus sp. TaxID=41978 RepID=UPI002E80ABD4|nr:G5 domain-containing protein [Ruminococcus sp.]MEE3492660.1 G5 domain-containing protein [Ruminococcus sp.]